MLTCANIGKVYLTDRGEVPAVNNIDLEIPRGQFAAIVGRSGSGKSSLLAIIGGLCRPSRGTVRFGDTDIWALSDTRLAQFRSSEIGFVFQFQSLLPTLRIIDNVALPALLTRQQSAALIYRNAAELLERMELAGFDDAYPAELSSGEQRRAVIARALINSPSVMLADEPTSDLDEQTENDVMEQLRSLNRDRHVTFIMVTHNLRLAEQAQQILHIADGRVLS